jgi:ABC-type glycerol-3-phosphate transport system substrate-binding protein
MSRISRRKFLQGLSLAAAGAAAAACQPKTVVVEKEVTNVVEKEVEKIVKETVVIPAEKATEIDLWWNVGDYEEIVVESFEEAFPSIDINLAEIGDTVWGSPKFRAAMAAGRGPDVAWQPRHTFRAFAARGLFLPIEDLMDRDGYTVDDFPARPMDSVTWEGHVYGLPYVVDDRFFFWNRTHFEEAGLDPDKAPESWADIELYTSELVKTSGDQIDRYGFLPGFPPGLRDQLIIFGLENGARPLDPEGKVSLLGDEKWVEALEWCVHMLDDYGGGFEVASGTMSAMSGQAQDMFASGQISMCSYGSWMMATYGTFPDLDYNGTVLMPPSPSNKGAKVNWTCHWNFVVLANSEHTDESFEFIKFAISPESFKVQSTIGLERATDKWTREGLPGKPIYYPGVPAYRPSTEWARQELYTTYPEREMGFANQVADSIPWVEDCGLLGGLVGPSLWTVLPRAWEQARSHELSAAEAMEQARDEHQKAIDEAWQAIEEEKVSYAPEVVSVCGACQ